VKNGCGAHAAFYSWGGEDFAPGLKRPGRESDHAPPSSAEVKNLYNYTSIPPHAFRLLNNVNLIFMFNLLTPNVNYSGHTAPLTAKVAFYIFIQQIYVLNILNMVYTFRFFFFKMQFVS